MIPLDAIEASLANNVQRLMSGNDVAHAFDHVREVARLAKWLMTTVPADPRIVIASAYCHDLRSRSDAGFEQAIPMSIKDSKPLLLELGYTDNEIEQVADCIVTSSWEHFLNGGQPSSQEAVVLRDADWLEATGAHGLSRVFAFAGSHGRPLTFVDLDPEQPTRLSTSASGPDASPFHHFYSKLLWLRDHFVSEPARREAEIRHRYLVEFLKEYRAEYVRTSCPTDSVFP